MDYLPYLPHLQNILIFKWQINHKKRRGCENRNLFGGCFPLMGKRGGLWKLLYVQNFEVSYQREFFGLALGSIDDTDDGQHKDNQSDNTYDGGNEPPQAQ